MLKRNWSLRKDLERILTSCEKIFEDFRSANIFITGATGFIGCNFLEALRFSNDQLALNLKVTVLSRNPARFFEAFPQLSSYSAFEFICGDVSSFKFPTGDFDYVIHGATDASASLNENDPLTMLKTIVDGTNHVLDFSVKKNVRRVLLMSSGAVYGPQPADISHVEEIFPLGPDPLNPRSAYGEGKRVSELLGAIYFKQHSLHVTIARIFALLGPYLPLTIHYAAGNFLKNSIDGKPIIIQGDGSPIRSYLYTQDLITALLFILLRAEACVPYNVGSPEGISLLDLAITISEIIRKVPIDVRGEIDKGWNVGAYVPCTERLHIDFGLKPQVTLSEAIVRTANWNK